ncbi:pre-mRNA-splicing factor CWC25 homolog isoform X2 [Zootermopsis nevadensis]|nr:pre-mRNA-splicing factor CWC25 homolog isoform X2 [Zootermopsis nevadensis]
MRNMEKVWKAEQKHDQEKKRIAELQREIREEKAREDIQKYAQDKGVVEKKDNMKLDWMYKGPGGMVDREEYLLGRAIDKSFEQMQHAEKASTSRNTIELDCLPSSIFSVGEQVDMARKLQEDPLYIIKKIEIESQSQILKNPVKLKQLQELVKEEKSKKTKKHKKDNRKKSERKKNRHDSDSHEDAGKDLDALLAAKYMKLKEKLSDNDIAKLKRSLNESADTDARYRNKAGNKQKAVSYRKRKHESGSSEEDKNDCQPTRMYGLQRTGSRGHSDRINHHHHHHQILGIQQTGVSSQAQSAPPKKVWVKHERQKLGNNEIEQRRQEMMDNARWREKEREKNIASYKAQDEKEKKQNKEYKGDFLRKQLSYAASQGSIEGRIKANINNIQRSGREMNKNFARR